MTLSCSFHERNRNITKGQLPCAIELGFEEPGGASQLRISRSIRPPSSRWYYLNYPFKGKHKTSHTPHSFAIQALPNVFSCSVFAKEKVLGCRHPPQAAAILDLELVLTFFHVWYGLFRILVMLVMLVMLVIFQDACYVGETSRHFSIRVREALTFRQVFERF